jgi:signal transduction histidine kinase
MKSLWVKLIGAFALVIFVGTGTVILLVNRATTGQFELYVTQTGQQWAAQLSPLLSEYYAQTGSWNGVEPILQNPWGQGLPNSAIVADDDCMGDEGGMMMDMGKEWTGSNMMSMDDGCQWEEPGVMMEDNMWTMSGNRLVLVDENWVIVADTGGAWEGVVLQSDDIERGMPITLQGQRVGTLIVTPFGSPQTPAGDFLASVNRSVLGAGFAAGLVALFLGSLLFFRIIRPLRSLAAAAHGIAQGDLDKRAWVGDDDEVGKVALTFNQMAETLQQYSKERQNMIADIAHELRTPLAVIQSNLEGMIDGVLPSSPDELVSLHQEALLLNRLIGDLRTLSLAETGQLNLEKQATDLGKLVQRVVDRLSLRAEEKKISIKTELAEDLPIIQADPERMRQVITNLVDNALRYTPAGTIITVAAHLSSGNIEMSVSDDGPGISPEDIPNVFDRFWRAEKSRSRVTGGSGLGLAIVKQLIEAHGGNISVVSEGLTKGTAFKLILPINEK